MGKLPLFEYLIAYSLPNHPCSTIAYADDIFPTFQKKNPHFVQNSFISPMLSIWGLVILHHLNTPSYTSVANEQWIKAWLVSSTMELQWPHIVEPMLIALFYGAYLVGIRSIFSLQMKHITLIGTSRTHYMIASLGVMLSLSIFSLEASTWYVLSVVRL